MDSSNWRRAVGYSAAQPLAIPTRRDCCQCTRPAELVDVTANGNALYVCSERHQSFVMARTRLGPTVPSTAKTPES